MHKLKLVTLAVAIAIAAATTWVAANDAPANPPTDVVVAGTDAADDAPPSPPLLSRQALTEMSKEVLVELCVNLQYQIATLQRKLDGNGRNLASQQITDLIEENKALRDELSAMGAEVVGATPTEAEPDAAVQTESSTPFDPSRYRYAYKLEYYAIGTYRGNRGAFYEAEDFRAWKHSRTHMKAVVNVKNDTGSQARFIFTVQACRRLSSLGEEKIDVLFESSQRELWLRQGEVGDVTVYIDLEDVKKVNYLQLANMQVIPGTSDVIHIE